MMNKGDIEGLIYQLEKIVKALNSDTAQLERKQLEGIIGGLYQTISQSDLANAQAVVKEADAIIKELENVSSD